jgi:phospholipid/cholesterol/gamma-HCH transport system substrate-binding protein
MAELKQPGLDEDDEIVTVALDPLSWMRVTVVLSFGLSVVLVLVYLLSDGGRELFQRKVTLRTYFSDGGGLEQKALVELDGIKIGHIQSVELSHSNEPSRVVRVNISLNRKYLDSIPVDSQTEVAADNLLGDKYVNIHKGTAHEFVKAGDELFARPPNNDFNPADLIASLQKVLDSVNLILDTADDPTTRLGQLVNSETLYDQIRDDIVGMQKAVYQVGNPQSAAGQAFFATELYDQLRKPINDIDKQLAAIESGEGAIGHAYASDEQYESLRRRIADFRKSVSDFRDNKLLTSDQKYQDLVESLRQLNVVVTNLSTGPLFEHSQLYESLNGSSKSAEQFLREFRNNPQKYLRIKVF